MNNEVFLSNGISKTYLEIYSNKFFSSGTIAIRRFFGTPVREESQTKNVPESGKSPKRGITAEDQNSNFGLFNKRGGVRIFRFFPNVNVTFNASVEQKNKLDLK